MIWSDWSSTSAVWITGPGGGVAAGLGRRRTRAITPATTASATSSHGHHVVLSSSLAGSGVVVAGAGAAVAGASVAGGRVGGLRHRRKDRGSRVTPRRFGGHWAVRAFGGDRRERRARPRRGRVTCPPIHSRRRAGPSWSPEGRVECCAIPRVHHGRWGVAAGVSCTEGCCRSCSPDGGRLAIELAELHRLVDPDDPR